MTNEQIYDSLKETRDEITRLNNAQGETVFNPAATQALEEAMRELWGRTSER